MRRHSLILCASLLTLTACGPEGTSIFVPPTNPGFSSSGATVSANPKLARTSPTPYVNTDVAFDVTTTGSANNLDITYGAETFTISKLAGTYSGTSAGGVTFSFTPELTTPEGEMIAGEITITDTGGDDYKGFAIIGWPTASAFMNQRTGTATYGGDAQIYVYRDNGKKTFADGLVTLTANFGTDKISGTIYNLADAGSDTGYAYSETGVPLHHINLKSADINGNSFTGTTITFDDIAAFGLTDPGSAAYSGMFYQQFGDAVGGNIYSDDATYTGGSAIITGGFAADN